MVFSNKLRKVSRSLQFQTKYFSERRKQEHANVCWWSIKQRLKCLDRRHIVRSVSQMASWSLNLGCWSLGLCNSTYINSWSFVGGMLIKPYIKRLVTVCNNMSVTPSLVPGALINMHFTLRQKRCVRAIAVLDVRVFKESTIWARIFYHLIWFISLRLPWRCMLMNTGTKKVRPELFKFLADDSSCGGRGGMRNNSKTFNQAIYYLTAISLSSSRHWVTR